MAGRRRGRGEGSIYRRKDGRWVGQYEVNGKRRYVYGRIRKEVAEKLSKAIVERDAGLAFDSKNLSLAEYLDRWLDTIRGTLAPNTVRRHEELSRIHIKPALGKVKLSKLAPLQVQSLYRSKLDEGLSATTGLRIGEALALRWDDLDLGARTLRVNRTVFRNEISQPKTKSSRRTIKLSELAVAALRHHPRTAELVFCTGSGKPINVSNLRNRSWKRLRECAGLPSSIRLHDIRHSTATLLLSRRVPVKVVSETLGHADVGITLSVYAHVLPNMQDEAAKTIDTFFGAETRKDSDA